MAAEAAARLNELNRSYRSTPVTMIASSTALPTPRATRCVRGTDANRRCTARGTGPSSFGVTQIAVRW